MLKITNLVVSSKDKKRILDKLNLEVSDGEIHAIVGRNGSGKSTLASTIAGDPEYIVESGDVLINNESIINLPPFERSRRGLFYAFQNPVEVEGVTLLDFLWESFKATKGDKALTSFKFRRHAKEIAEQIGLNQEFLERYLNVGFSGGEKKKCEVLQLMLLEPKVAILDETDSGLDVSAVKKIAGLLKELQQKNGMSLIIITHLGKFADAFDINKVHIIEKGKIIRQGNKDLIKEIEENGYAE